MFVVNNNAYTKSLESNNEIQSVINSNKEDNNNNISSLSNKNNNNNNSKIAKIAKIDQMDQWVSNINRNPSWNNNNDIVVENKSY